MANKFKITRNTFKFPKNIILEDDENSVEISPNCSFEQLDDLEVQAEFLGYKKIADKIALCRNVISVVDMSSGDVLIPSGINLKMFGMLINVSKARGKQHLAGQYRYIKNLYDELFDHLCEETCPEFPDDPKVLAVWFKLLTAMDDKRDGNIRKFREIVRNKFANLKKY